MRIEARDAERRPLGRIEVDPAERPTRARARDTGREVFLDWETALDDAHRLRRCIVCGCGDLFRAKAFPQITGVVVLLAFAGAVIGALGLATPPMLMAMTAVLVADVAILIFARQRLVCYRCRSSYGGVPIARHHRRWDGSLAERHAPPAPARRAPRRWRWPALHLRPRAATRERPIV